MSRRKAQLALLAAAGVVTVGDALELSEGTALYSGAGLSSLPDQIDRARAALGAAPVYRRRGIDSVSVPRADVEVDVDMENVEDGVYLWGALLTDRHGVLGTCEGYHSFVSWEPLSQESQSENFLRFWTWLMQIRDATREAGGTFHAYCYNASAENTHLSSLGLLANVKDEVEAFIGSGDWIDLLRAFDTQLVTGGSSGLKIVTALAGFSWEVDDPGGGESMLRYDAAVGSQSEDERNAARRWLLDYNRGDVEATLALRDWLDSASVPSVETLTP